MYDLFYIIKVSSQCYNLLVRDTHYCLACGSNLESFKRTIYNYVRKYKTEDRVYKALSGLSDSGIVLPTTFDKRSKDYGEGKHLVFNDLVRGVVEKALKDNRQDTPYNRTKKKVRSITPIGVATQPTPPSCEVRAVGKIRPCKIKRITT